MLCNFQFRGEAAQVIEHIRYEHTAIDTQKIHCAIFELVSRQRQCINNHQEEDTDDRPITSTDEIRIISETTKSEHWCIPIVNGKREGFSIHVMKNQHHVSMIAFRLVRNDAPDGEIENSRKLQIVIYLKDDQKLTLRLNPQDIQNTQTLKLIKQKLEKNDLETVRFPSNQLPYFNKIKICIRLKGSYTSFLNGAGRLLRRRYGFSYPAMSPILPPPPPIDDDDDIDDYISIDDDDDIDARINWLDDDDESDYIGNNEQEENAENEASQTRQSRHRDRNEDNADDHSFWPHSFSHRSDRESSFYNYGGNDGEEPFGSGSHGHYNRPRSPSRLDSPRNHFLSPLPPPLDPSYRRGENLFANRRSLGFRDEFNHRLPRRRILSPTRHHLRNFRSWFSRHFPHSHHDSYPLHPPSRPYFRNRIDSFPPYHTSPIRHHATPPPYVSSAPIPAPSILDDYRTNINHDSPPSSPDLLLRFPMYAPQAEEAFHSSL